MPVFPRSGSNPIPAKKRTPRRIRRGVRLSGGPHAGRVVLMDADALDAAWSQRGLEPEVPGETVRVELDEGRRVSVNALYRKT